MYKRALDQQFHFAPPRGVISPAQHLAAFKAGLTSLRRRKAFVPYWANEGFAQELCVILDHLELGASDPKAGVKGMMAFYRADAAVFGRCDDSSGVIGDIFRIEAADLFGRFGERCDDKKWLAKQVFDLVAIDGYGVRAAVLRGAIRFLSEQSMRDLANKMWVVANARSEPRGARRELTRSEAEWARKHWFLLIESIAEQLRDPVLFERACRAHHPPLHTAAYIDIARVWFASGDAAKALEWLRRIAPGESFQAYERDTLLREVYLALAMQGPLEELVWAGFLNAPSVGTLSVLLEAIGKERRDEAIVGAAARIVREPGFTAYHAQFLLEAGREGIANEYLISRHAMLNGRDWPSLLSLIELLQVGGNALALTVVYRALLDSILARAETKAYGHGARYLRTLERLEGRVVDWRDVPRHDAYVLAVREKHGRKVSFWGRCGG